MHQFNFLQFQLNTSLITNLLSYNNQTRLYNLINTSEPSYLSLENSRLKYI